MIAALDATVRGNSDRRLAQGSPGLTSVGFGFATDWLNCYPVAVTTSFAPVRSNHSCVRVRAPGDLRQHHAIDSAPKSGPLPRRLARERERDRPCLALSRPDFVHIEAVHAFDDLVERILDGEVARS
jgi:hypothetical protein